MVSSCQRELYFETAPSTLPVDTSVSAEHQLPVCNYCIGQDFYSENRWSMRADTTFLCGEIDTAIISLSREVFTLFGPSACSLDTGLILTVYPPVPLKRDTTNMRIDKVTFSYYKTGAPYIFSSRNTSPFSLTILDYQHQSRIATGTFEGFVYRQNGLSAYINAAKFRVKLH